MDPDTALLARTEFPVTPWPASPLPPLPVGVLPAIALNDGWIVDLSESADDLSANLPTDFALRASQTTKLSSAIASDADVLEFYVSHGAPRWADGEIRRLGPPGAITRVHDARADLQRVLAATQHWVAATDGGGVVKPWVDHGVDGVETARDAWQEFEDVLEMGLMPYKPRVTVHFPNPLMNTMRWPEHAPIERTWERERRVYLVEAMCRELFNLLVESRPIRTCPTCAIRFVRHTGDAKHGQHRQTGVEYCSTACRNKERQRRYRAKKKAERHEKGGQG